MIRADGQLLRTPSGNGNTRVASCILAYGGLVPTQGTAVPVAVADAAVVGAARRLASLTEEAAAAAAQIMEAAAADFAASASATSTASAATVGTASGGGADPRADPHQMLKALVNLERRLTLIAGAAGGDGPSAGSLTTALLAHARLVAKWAGAAVVDAGQRCVPVTQVATEALHRAGAAAAAVDTPSESPGSECRATAGASVDALGKLRQRAEAQPEQLSSPGAGKAVFAAACCVARWGQLIVLRDGARAAEAAQEAAQREERERVGLLLPQLDRLLAAAKATGGA